MSREIRPPESSRSAILRLLCAGGRTAGELAGELGISTNAARKALARLSAEDLVRYNRVTRGVGKPAHEYEITAEGELRLSRSYLPLLHAVLNEIEETLPVTNVEDVLRGAGRRLAPPRAGGELRERVIATASMLNDLGASASVNESSSGLLIECSCCAIGAVVAAHPLACKAMEAFVADHLGAPVREQCERDDRPRCRFRVGEL